MKKYKIGFNSEGKFKTKIDKKETREYSIWRSILRRCYSKEYHDKYPTYIGCSIDKTWLDFQIFAEWYEKNYITDYLIDKDILFKGNKIYGPDTCCFVPLDISNLLIKRDNKRNDTLIGVSFNNQKQDINKYSSQISICGNIKHLVFFPDEISAFEVYKITKEKHIKDIANKWKNEIPENVYLSLYNYIIEITD